MEGMVLLCASDKPFTVNFLSQCRHEAHMKVKDASLFGIREEKVTLVSGLIRSFLELKMELEERATRRKKKVVARH